MSALTMDIAAESLKQLYHSLELIPGLTSTETYWLKNTMEPQVARWGDELKRQVEAGTFDEPRWWSIGAAHLDNIKSFLSDALTPSIAENLAQLYIDINMSMARAAAKAIQVAGDVAANIDKPTEWPWYAYAGLGIAAIIGVSIVVRNFGVGINAVRARPIAGLSSGQRKKSKKNRR